MGLVRDTSAGGNVWQLDKDLGADEDDGIFMEASPMEESPADDDEVISFPVGKTASTGLPLTRGISTHRALLCGICPECLCAPKSPPLSPQSYSTAVLGHLNLAGTDRCVKDGKASPSPCGRTGATAGPSLDAQVAARAEFNVEKADAFYSSDEDDAQSSAAASDIGGPKFKVLTTCAQCTASVLPPRRGRPVRHLHHVRRCALRSGLVGLAV